MTVISGGKENLRANFIRENFKGHHSTYTISKSLRHDPSYRNSLGLKRTAEEFVSFYPTSDATLKEDSKEQRPSTRRTALGRTRALSFRVSAWGCARRRCPPQTPAPVALSRPRGNASPGFLRDTGQVRRARSGPRRAASERGVTRRLPAASRRSLGYIHVFPSRFFFQKISCGEPKASRDPRSRQIPRHSPPSKRTAPALAARHSQLPAKGQPQQQRRNPGPELRRSQIPTEASPDGHPGP